MLENLINKGLIYDIEIYQNFFLVSFYSLRASKYKIFFKFDAFNEQDVNQLKEIIKNSILIGFNSWNFDDAVLNHLFKNPGISVKELWEFSQKLINRELFNPYKYSSDFESYDVLEILRAGYSVTSLKNAANILNHEVIQDLPIPFNSEITKDQVEDLIKYNKNDIIITHKIFIYLKPRLEMRILLSEKYNLNLYSLSDSSIAKEIFLNKYTKEFVKKYPLSNPWKIKKERTYRDEISFKDVIDPNVSFDSFILKKFLYQLKQITLTKNGEKIKVNSKHCDRHINDLITSSFLNKCDEQKIKEDLFSIDLKPITYKDTTYKLGLGGIHSEDKPGIFKADENHIILDRDGTSYYPSSIINFNICPEHLDSEIFLNDLITFKDDRVYYKNKKKENVLFDAIQQGLKITLNAIFGLFGFENFMLFDLLCTYKTTINNQLWLLKLIEMLCEENISIISANTDGIVMYLHKDLKERCDVICKEWEKLSKFNLEDTYYDLYVRRDVNNYLARKINGEVKIKGCFVPNVAYLEPYYKYDLPKVDGKYLPINALLGGYKHPITAIALHRYYLDSIPPENTIEDHKNIYDFCCSEKTGSQFTNYIEYIKRKITTHKVKSKKIKVKEKIKIPKIETETLNHKILKNGKTKYFTEKKLIEDKKIISAKYQTIYFDGDPYVNPKVEDELISEQKVQKTMRYFVSNPVDSDNDGNIYGYSLKKEKDLADGKKQRNDFCAKRFITEFNVFKKKDSIEDYNIDYNFYIEETYKVINKIGEMINDVD